MPLNRLIGVLAVLAAVGCSGELPVPQPVVVTATPPPPGTVSPWLGGEQVGAEPETFVVLAGNWTVRAEGAERVLRVDGTNWKVGTPPIGLSGKAAALFPSSAAAFEK